MFNLYSGKIFIYLNKRESSIIKNESSEYIFYWETDTLNPYKIKGIYSEIDKDTLLFWNYNPKTKQLIDEKGVRYYKKTFKN